MRRLFSILALLLLAGVLTVSAQSSTPPLLQMLAHIPDSDLAHQSLSYVDYSALIAARSGAPTVSTWQQFETLKNAQSDAFHLYMSGLMGVSSGPDFLNYLFSNASKIPDVLGFDYFGINQAVEYGQPPAQVALLTGNIETKAVIAAHEKRGYTSSSVNDFTLLCPPNGCDSGTQPDPKNINTANLFGGNLGRNEPVLVEDHLIVNSASIDAVKAIANLSAGNSLADNPDYRAAAEGITANGTLLQTYFITPVEAASANTISVGASGAQATQIAQQLSTREAGMVPLPPYNLVAFADTATKDEEQTLIAFVYTAQATAQSAAALFPDHLQKALSLRANETFGQLLNGRGVTSIDTSVYKASTNRYVLVVTLHAPLPSSTPSADNNQLQSMSLVYHLLIQAYVSRDLNWLAIQS